MSEPKRVKELSAGSTVDSTFLVMEKELREFSTKEGYYLQVKLGDSTGSIWARCWERAPEVAALFELGDIVRVKGVVESFRGRLHLIFEPAGIERSSQTFDVTDYLPRTSKDIDRLFEELVQTAKSMTNEHLKCLVLSFLTESQYARAFKTAPAAKIHHHNYIGGLIEHTEAVVRICETLAALYPELDRDLLLAGALLHDAGKTASYKYTFQIDVTTEGGLVNHIVLGYRMVEAKIGAQKDFPEELGLKLLHLILSHHTEINWGSPVKPLFAEAEALSYADLLDSQLKEFLQIQKHEEAKGREAVWSDFIRRLDRFLYLGSEKRRALSPEKERPQAYGPTQ